MTAQECFFIFLNNMQSFFFVFKGYFNFFKVAILEAKMLINKLIPGITPGANIKYYHPGNSRTFALEHHTRISRSTQQIILG